MNKIYRLKFSKRLQQLIVVSDIAKGYSFSSSSNSDSKVMKKQTALFSIPNLSLFAAFVSSILVSQSTFANGLQGMEVISGKASMEVNGITTTIKNSPNTIINWQQFNINKGDMVEFIQENKHSSVFNKVTSSQLSQLNGTLKSNGQVFLINPNGIVFGKDAVIDTSSFVASTLNLSNDDIKKGKLNFEQAKDKAIAEIINNGLITVSKDGTIGLVGGSVTNNGKIKVENGNVLLAAGQKITISDLANPTITYSLSAPKNEVLNLGEVFSKNGKINLSGGKIANKGKLKADSSVKGKRGEITISSKEGDISLNGEISSQGVYKGGVLKVTGNSITLEENAEINLTGENGGGTAYIGGDEKGKGEIQLSTRTEIKKKAKIDASAIKKGNGGKVIVWGNHADINGTIKATGGDISGNGGFIETSGKHIYFGEAFNVNTSAKNGKGGEWLLDPKNLHIVSEAERKRLVAEEKEYFEEYGRGLIRGYSYISNLVIQNQLNMGVSVSKSADSLIRMYAPIRAFSDKPATLSLSAHHLNIDVDLSGQLGLDLKAYRLQESRINTNKLNANVKGIFDSNINNSIVSLQGADVVGGDINRGFELTYSRANNTFKLIFPWDIKASFTGSKDFPNLTIRTKGDFSGYIDQVDNLNIDANSLGASTKDTILRANYISLPVENDVNVYRIEANKNLVLKTSNINIKHLYGQNLSLFSKGDIYVENLSGGEKNSLKNVLLFSQGNIKVKDYGHAGSLIAKAKDDLLIDRLSTNKMDNLELSAKNIYLLSYQDSGLKFSGNFKLNADNAYLYLGNTQVDGDVYLRTKDALFLDLNEDSALMSKGNIFISEGNSKLSKITLSLIFMNKELSASVYDRIMSNQMTGDLDLYSNKNIYIKAGTRGKYEVGVKEIEYPSEAMDYFKLNKNPVEASYSEVWLTKSIWRAQAKGTLCINNICSTKEHELKEDFSGNFTEVISPWEDGSEISSDIDKNKPNIPKNEEPNPHKPVEEPKPHKPEVETPKGNGVNTNNSKDEITKDKIEVSDGKDSSKSEEIKPTGNEISEDIVGNTDSNDNKVNTNESDKEENNKLEYQMSYKLKLAESDMIYRLTLSERVNLYSDIKQYYELKGEWTKAIDSKFQRKIFFERGAGHVVYGDSIVEDLAQISRKYDIPELHWSEVLFGVDEVKIKRAKEAKDKSLDEVLLRWGVNDRKDFSPKGFEKHGIDPGKYYLLNVSMGKTGKEEISYLHIKNMEIEKIKRDLKNKKSFSTPDEVRDELSRINEITKDIKQYSYDLIYSRNSSDSLNILRKFQRAKDSFKETIEFVPWYSKAHALYDYAKMSDEALNRFLDVVKDNTLEIGDIVLEEISNGKAVKGIDERLSNKATYKKMKTFISNKGKSLGFEKGNTLRSTRKKINTAEDITKKVKIIAGWGHAFSVDQTNDFMVKSAEDADRVATQLRSRAKELELLIERMESKNEK